MPHTPSPPAARGRALVAGLLMLLQPACGGPALAAPPQLEAGSVVHGPFEIVARERRISTGTFPNQGGNPFATRGVSEFQVRWRGQPVATAGGNARFWRVLRLTDAPRPALLLVTTGFALAAEDAAGRLQVTPLRSESSALAELQWLDANQGQPGPSEQYGIEAVPDLQAGTRLGGGRWLRLGSRSVMDVRTLAVYPVEPWVPIHPGVPVTSLSREGDDARAFSPRGTRYVLAASGLDYGRAGQPQAYGLLVVDIAQGTTSELRMDRRRFRFAETGDIDAAWIDHHFHWQDDGAGHEQLVPRDRFNPWPWRARLWESSPGTWQLDVPRIDAAAFLGVLRRLLEASPQARLAAVPKADAELAQDFTLAGCPLQARAFGTDGFDADDLRLSMWPRTDAPARQPAQHTATCEAAMRQLAAMVDAELATGRHDALLKLD